MSSLELDLAAGRPKPGRAQLQAVLPASLPS